MSRLLGKIIKNNNGQILPMIALGMAVFLGFAAISVDYGYLAWQRRSLQNAADAGALAAAWELPNPGGSVNQTALNDEAMKYTDEHVPASFDGATPINNNEAVTVRAEKDYDRIFFSRIFTFFDENAATSDTLSAEATAARLVYYWDGLLPFSLLERYEEEWDEELEEDVDIWDAEKTNYFNKWSSEENAELFVESQDYLSYKETVDNKVRIDEADSSSKELYKEDIDYFDLFMGTLKGETISFRLMSDTSSANYGLLYLPTEDDPDGAKVIDILQNNAGLPISFIGMDLGYKPGWLAAIENPGQTNLSDKLAELDKKGYIIAVLPSVAENTDPSSNADKDNPSKTVLWGNYLIIELESINVVPDPDHPNQVDSDNPVEGTIVDSYNIYRGERPKNKTYSNMRLGSVLIKP